MLPDNHGENRLLDRITEPLQGEKAFGAARTVQVVVREHHESFLHEFDRVSTIRGARRIECAVGRPADSVLAHDDRSFLSRTNSVRHEQISIRDDAAPDIEYNDIA